METKYSKTEFEDYTHRFIVKFSVDEDWRNDTNIHIYSNNESYDDLVEFLKTKIKPKVKSFNIEHRATKEQDDAASKLIDEFLNDKL
jgi:hypothetical protein